MVLQKRRPISWHCVLLILFFCLPTSATTCFLLLFFLFVCFVFVCFSSSGGRSCLSRMSQPSLRACPHSGPSSAVAYFSTASTSRSADRSTCFRAAIPSSRATGHRKIKDGGSLIQPSRTRCSASHLVMPVQKRRRRQPSQETRSACFPFDFTLCLSDITNDADNCWFLCFRWPRRLLCSARVWQHRQHIWGENWWSTSKTRIRSQFLSAPHIELGNVYRWDAS